MGPGQLVKRTASIRPAAQGKPDCTWHYSVPYAVPASQIGLAVGEFLKFRAEGCPLVGLLAARGLGVWALTHDWGTASVVLDWCRGWCECLWQASCIRSQHWLS